MGKLGKGAAAVLATSTVIGLAGKELIDLNLKHSFEEQKTWMIEHISSPKYRERIKRSIARGFFEKGEQELTEEEKQALRTQGLEELFPTNIDTSDVSDELVNDIISKRLENVQNAKLGIVNFIDEGFFTVEYPFDLAITRGIYVTPEYSDKLRRGIDPWFFSKSAEKRIKEGKNILLERAANFFDKVRYPSLAAHELSHASTSIDENLEPKAQNITRERIVRESDSLGELTEVKANLDAFRFELFKRGIYDASFEDFNQTHLDKIKKDKKFRISHPFQRLFNTIEQDMGYDLIWYMNNIL